MKQQGQTHVQPIGKLSIVQGAINLNVLQLIIELFMRI